MFVVAVVVVIAAQLQPEHAVLWILERVFDLVRCAHATPFHLTDLSPLPPRVSTAFLSGRQAVLDVLAQTVFAIALLVTRVLARAVSPVPAAVSPVLHAVHPSVAAAPLAGGVVFLVLLAVVPDGAAATIFVLVVLTAVSSVVSSSTLADPFVSVSLAVFHGCNTETATAAFGPVGFVEKVARIVEDFGWGIVGVSMGIVLVVLAVVIEVVRTAAAERYFFLVVTAVVLHP